MVGKKVRHALLGIAPQEATFAARGFRSDDPAKQRHLETIGSTFIEGYQAALDEDSPARLGTTLDAVPPLYRGFAYEGAAMALAARDLMTPWRERRVTAFLEAIGRPHIYMAHVGIGWLYARLRRPLTAPPAHLSPLLGWLVLDGYGFHEGYFHWPRTIAEQVAPHRLNGYAARVYDQGLGRSLWFVKGADVAAVIDTVNAFPRERRADLWSGVGLACTYAGGVMLGEVDRLQAAAGDDRYHLAQGAAFAAQARRRAGYLAAHTQLTCEALCGCTAHQAADITQETMVDLAADGVLPAYAVWRRRIRHALAAL